MALNWTRDWESLIGEFRYPNDDPFELDKILRLEVSEPEGMIEALYWLTINRPEFYEAYMDHIEEVMDIVEAQTDYQSITENVSDEEISGVFDAVTDMVFGNQSIDIGTGVNAQLKTWSRDWDQFDWESVERKLQQNPEIMYGNSVDFSASIGLSREEFLEFLEWFSMKHPEGSAYYMIAATLVHKYGLTVEEAEEVLQDETKLNILLNNPPDLNGD